MGAIASIIIPVAAHHVAISQQAIASAENQTVECEVISLLDTEGLGAGYMRNKGVSLSTCPFVMFLDADDVIERDAVQKLIAHYRRGHYVYSDFIVNGQLFRTPDCSPVSIWQTGAVHLVTCLIPTGFHYAAGGFDASLSGFEDTEYFVRMHTLGMCGLRCPEPLIHYRSRLGSRSQTFSKSGLYDKMNADLIKRYARYRNVGCSCGGNAPQQIVSNVPQVGMVLCECNYAPAVRVGSGTGTRYERAGHGDRLWVWPADVDRHPNWWRVVSAPYDNSPDIDAIMELVNA